MYEAPQKIWQVRANLSECVYRGFGGEALFNDSPKQRYHPLKVLPGARGSAFRKARSAGNRPPKVFVWEV
jgi:hypothetical protein